MRGRGSLTALIIAALSAVIALSFSGCIIEPGMHINSLEGGSSGGRLVLSYTVYFDGRDANVAADPSSIKVISPETTVGTLPVPPTRNGYRFLGWALSTKSKCPDFDAGTTVTQDTTVYAMWKEERD